MALGHQGVPQKIQFVVSVVRACDVNGVNGANGVEDEGSVACLKWPLLKLQPDPQCPQLARGSAGQWALGIAGLNEGMAPDSKLV
jgi:hypothetical protein